MLDVGWVLVMKKNNRSILAVALSTAVLILFFQNCRSQVQIDDVTKSGALSSNDGDNLAANTPDGENSQQPSDPKQGSGGSLPVPEDPFSRNDPTIGLLPIEGDWASVAFEDNIDSSSAGDRDYNDAVFNYRISEQYNANSQLVRVFIEVRLREKISDGTHRLNLSLNGNPSSYFSNIDHLSAAAFNGQATVKIKYHNGDQSTVADAKNKIINLFRNTTNTKGQVSKIQIDLARPDLNVNSAAVKVVNYKRYRLILQNHGSNKGIDIAEINPTNEMLSNGNGYPFGFMIPTDWTPPAEKQLIDNKYPNFFKYREWLNGSQQGAVPDAVTNWYK